MKHTLRLGVFLALLWLLLSGLFFPLMLTFGVISVLMVIWLSSRMVNVDGRQYPLFITWDFLKFIVRLAKRIVLSNIDVTLHVLGFKPVTSRFIKINVPFDDDLSKVLYANAITLTPGSASVHMEGQELYVHTLSAEGAQDLLSGDMEKIIPPTRERLNDKEAG